MYGPRALPELTLDNILDRVTPPGETLVVSTLDVTANLVGTNPIVNVRTGPERSIVELPGSGSIPAFGDFLGIPSAFIKKVPTQLAQTIINTMLHEKAGEIRVRYGEHSIHDIQEANRQQVATESLVEIVKEVIGSEGIILDFDYQPWEFSLDVVSPDGGSAIGGDRAVGDLTHGGLRVTHDIKRNLAPSVSKIMYRLVCTNGMEVPDVTSKIDARGSTIDQMLDDLEIVARRLYAEVETDISHFYDLRNNLVTDPTQSVLRLAREAHLSERVQLNLVERIPELIESENPTEFDVANAISNFALADMAHGTRRQLERLSGSVVTDHAARCSHCLAKLA